MSVKLKPLALLLSEKEVINTGTANPESYLKSIVNNYTCWKTVVSRFGGWTFLNYASSVAYGI